MTHRLAVALSFFLFSCKVFAGLHFTTVPFAYPAGLIPDSIAVTDVNLDGRPDFVVAHSQDTFISVLTNRGDGVFVAAPSISLGPCGKVIADDVNGDGAPDIIAMLISVSGFVVLTNTGGNFAFASTNTGLTALPAGFIAVDLDGDGWKEVVSTYGGRPLQVYTNNHLGTFSFFAEYSTGGVYPWALAPGDFNSDGSPDLLVIHSDNPPTFMTNNGQGILVRGSVISGYGTGGAPRTADMNHDMLIDIMLGNRLLTNNGAGEFSLANSNIAGSSAMLQEVADLNSDGWPEALAFGFSGTLNVRTNDHTNIFSTAVELQTGGTGFGFLKATDVNGDGSTDLIYGLSGSVNLSFGYSTPPLSIERDAPNNVLVSWPFTTPLTYLQSATNCGATPLDWTSRTPSTNAALRRLELSVPASRPMEFFRLMQ